MDASVKRHFITLPNILLIHVKRFYFEDGRSGKYDDIISYPEILEIDPKFLCDQSKEKKVAKKYELIGVIVHTGMTMLKGHYVSYVS